MPENPQTKKIDRSVYSPVKALQGDLFGCGGWSLEPHICARCFGRILSQVTATGERQYLCSNCGLVAEGTAPSVICACGIKLRKPVEGKRLGSATVDAGIRCHLNPSRSAQFPSEVVASFKGSGSETRFKVRCS